jgi:hypothetical protein
MFTVIRAELGTCYFFPYLLFANLLQFNAAIPYLYPYTATFPNFAKRYSLYAICYRYFLCTV